MGIMKNTNGRAVSMPEGLLRGGITSLIITVVLTALLAKMVSTEKIEWEMIGYGIMVTLLISAFIGALVAYKGIKRQRLVVCGAAGVVYYVFLIAITALFFGGQYDGALVSGILILGGSLAAGLLGSRQNQSGKRRKGKILHR